MAVELNSFHITDLIYDSDNHTLTYKFLDGKNTNERVGIGFTTDDDIVTDFHKTIVNFYSKS